MDYNATLDTLALRIARLEKKLAASERAREEMKAREAMLPDKETALYLLGNLLAERLDEDNWNLIEPYLRAAEAALRESKTREAVLVEALNHIAEKTKGTLISRWVYDYANGVLLSLPARSLQLMEVVGAALKFVGDLDKRHYVYADGTLLIPLAKAVRALAALDQDK